MDDLVSDAEENIASCEETSSEETEDVKVCDICGDVGKEKKLAVCCRCNDGAAHTYCMRVMIKEVPESGWLCEECQAEVEIEKKKLEESQVNVGMISSENRVDNGNVGHKDSREENQGNDITVKRKEEGMSNVAAWNKRLNTHTEAKSYEEIEDVKVCDICGDVGEVEKLAICGRCNDGAEHVYCMRVMMEKVPDVKWLCEACQSEVEITKKRMKLQKLEVMVGASQGQSFEGQTNKLVNDRNSRSSSEAEMVGSKEPNMRNQPDGMASTRTEKDAGITSVIREKLSEPGGVSMQGDSRKRVPPSHESSLKLDSKKGKEPTRQMLSSLLSHARKNQAPALCGKFANNQATPLHGSLSKSISFNNSKVPKVKPLVIEVPPKPKHFKGPLSCITKQKGPMSTLAKSASFKQPNSSEPHGEEPRLMNSPMNRNVTDKRGTSISGYPSDAASMIAPFSSEAQSAAQCLNNRNNMDNLGMPYRQGGINSGAQRKVIQNPDTSRVDKIKNPPSLKSRASSSSQTMRCERCNDVGHSILLCPVDRFSLFARKPLNEQTNGQTARSNRTSEATTLVVTEDDILRSADQPEPILKRRPCHNSLYKPIDVSCNSSSHAQSNEQKMGNCISTPSSASSVHCLELKYKEHQAVSAMGRRYLDSNSTELTDKTPIFSPSDEGTAPTFPELACIWQGCFELWRTGKSPELCEGLQVHLSSSASPKVLEIAKKFPSKIQLEELPRQNLWPLQFHENVPIYDSIGLFFFARDIQSYENHYNKLVENMLKDDLALRGNIETAELLIFPSNILSKNFQRWNMLYYLWGVFRVRRNGTCEDLQCLQPLEANHERCHYGENSNHPLCRGPPEYQHPDSITASFSTNNSSAINDFVTVPTRKNQEHAYSEQEEKMRDRADHNGKANTVVNHDNAEHLMDANHVNTTQVCSHNADHISHVSGGAHKRDVETANWADEVNVSHKKIKLDNGCSVKPMSG